MRQLIAFATFALTALFFATPGHAQTADPPACAPYRAKWESLSGGSDIAAMDGLIKVIPSLCPALKKQARERRASFARAAICKPTEYYVYFPHGSAILNEDGASVIVAAARYIRANNCQRAIIVGQTDTFASDAESMALSLSRAETVSRELKKISGPVVIELAGKGETDPAVKTGDGVREAINNVASLSLR